MNTIPKLSALLLAALLAVSCFGVKRNLNHRSHPSDLGQPASNNHQSRRSVRGEAGGVGSVILEYEGFSLSYNPRFKIPDWVEYELTAEETEGAYSRKGKNFRQDEAARVPQADSEDYRGSGWSRGHMAPAGDFKWSDSALWDTFFYTNCCPQDAGLNTGKWNSLEIKVRQWARTFGAVDVVTGPVVGGNRHGSIGAGRVVVPDAFFKAVMARTPEGAVAIAFVLRNGPDNGSLQSSALSVDELEELTGLDFFFWVKKSVERRAEASFSLDDWGL